jgi:hypothetical protein
VAGESEAEGSLGASDAEDERGFRLDAFLHGVQRGVATLAVRVGEAFSHLGNFLRRLGDNLKASL